MSNRFTKPYSPPRIGVDFHTWDGLFQGLRSHVLGIYKEAIVQAPDIEFVFFLNGTDSLRDQHSEFRNANVKLVKIARMPGPLRLAFQLPYLQLRHRLDLLHMQFRLPFVRVGGTAVTIHDVLFETHPEFFKPSFVWQSKITCRQAAQRADVVYAVSQFSRQEIARCYDVAPESIHVTYNGVDKERFHPKPGGEESLNRFGLTSGGYILTVGRLEPRKNHQTLVEAYSRLHELAPPLVIVGQRDFSYEGIAKVIESTGLRHKVHILEDVSDVELPALLRHAQLFVYPAFAEGFGMPVAEAMASGVPVITSNTTSLPEVAGEAALFASPKSADELHAAISQAVADAALRQRMAELGAARAAQFDWASAAQVLICGMRAFLESKTQGKSASAD